MWLNVYLNLCIQNIYCKWMVTSVAFRPTDQHDQAL